MNERESEKKDNLLEYSKLTPTDYKGRTYNEIHMEMINLLNDIKKLCEIILEKTIRRRGP